MRGEVTITPFILFLVIFTVTISFLFGWVFPVEGPIDYMYDDYVGNKTIKKPVVSAPMQTQEEEKYYDMDFIDMEGAREVLIDLNEDGEQELYLFLPLLKGER